LYLHFVMAKRLWTQKQPSPMFRLYRPTIVGMNVKR
jgi:hypothetical protein